MKFRFFKGRRFGEQDLPDFREAGRGRPDKHPMRGHRGHHGRHGHHGHHRFGEIDGHHAIKRLLAHGDLRYVVLLLIEEKPRHGYELIKLIETKSSGQYVPSPGVIYPTLTYLEETGMVKTSLQDDKKLYAIEPDGKEHLDQNREVAASILRRLEEMGAKIASAKAHDSTEEPFGHRRHSELREAIHGIMFALKATPAQTAKNKKQIIAILERARAEISALTEGK